ncbi:MAG: argininosuccinate lyase [Fimbriimonadaceae bacterium]|nr:argininosuccinate lyase [Fimbriimonadaceae bacterium]
MRKLWGGAFSEGSDELVERFGQSIETDLRFWEEDVLGSIAHATMLGRTGIVSEADSALLADGLGRILREGPDGLPRDAEDVHTAVEARLSELVGEVAGKLHTARSRNDQVATDARLYLRKRYDELAADVKALQRVLLDLARTHREATMPGYTHQQRAQPYTLGFHLMASFWAFQRHGNRLDHARALANYSPLGAAAVAGTGFPIDRVATAEALGFAGPMPNALDATSDRSWALDGLHVCALIMLELSRMCQELVLWSGNEFGFVSLSDRVTTGSSIMPQKRNPDMAELIRGRAARAVGNYVTLATTMKGLPLGYNRDTQDDKPCLFESLDLTRDSMRLTALMLETATWRTDAMRRATKRDFSTATDLADFLAAQGTPFRTAHETVGKIARACRERGIGLEDLNVATLREIDPTVPEEALSVLRPTQSALSRNSQGGPGRRAMAAQIKRARALLARKGFRDPV